MPEIDLDKKYTEEIKKAVKLFIKDDIKIYIFGSRTKGCAHKYSDIDLALSGKDKIKTDVIYKISGYLSEETTIPYKVDIIDLNSIDEKFKKNIKKDLILLSGI